MIDIVIAIIMIVSQIDGLLRRYAAPEPGRQRQRRQHPRIRPHRRQIKIPKRESNLIAYKLAR